MSKKRHKPKAHGRRTPRTAQDRENVVKHADDKAREAVERLYDKKHLRRGPDDDEPTSRLKITR